MKPAPILEMEHIESLAREFALTRDGLGAKLQDLRDEQEAVKRRRLRSIREALSRFTASHDALKNAVQDSADLFKSPKTRVLHGIKVGFQKRPGKLDLGDADTVIKLIRKHFPDQFEALVKTTETPSRAALANLPAGDLKRLGVRITDDVDAVVIKAADSDLDKLIDALINDDELEEIR